MSLTEDVCGMRNSSYHTVESEAVVGRTEQNMVEHVKTYLQLHSFVVIVADDEADASVLFICDSQCHHTQNLHVL